MSCSFNVLKNSGLRIRDEIDRIRIHPLRKIWIQRDAPPPKKIRTGSDPESDAKKKLKTFLDLDPTQLKNRIRIRTSKNRVLEYDESKFLVRDE